MSCPKIKHRYLPHSLISAVPPPVSLLPSSLFFSCFRPLTLPLTCTISMVFQLPETPVQLSMVTRSVHRLLPAWLLFPPVCVEEREERRTRLSSFSSCVAVVRFAQSHQPAALSWGWFPHNFHLAFFIVNTHR